MDHFLYRDGRLYAEEVFAGDIAERVGTPCYVYSRATLERHWRAFDDAFGEYPHLVCYAVKANSNLAVLNLLARLGSGFDIVSVGELERVLLAGGDPGRVVFSGVAKTRDEIARALQTGVRCINVESAAELELVNQVGADLEVTAPIAVRVNPDVDAQTHPYIATGLKETKFGLSTDDAIDAYRRAATMPNVQVTGIACHIGSQITAIEPFIGALERIIQLVSVLIEEGIDIAHLDLGGGLGVPYGGESPPQPAEYSAAIIHCLEQHGVSLPIAIEPGRAIAGNAGILLTSVQFLKSNHDKHFAVVDAGMNDLLRPSLYQAWHDIVPVISGRGGTVQDYDIVGPICESGDVLGTDRSLTLKQGDLLAVRTAGAYGWVMSSNYNSRPRPPEVMVDGDQVHLVRRRERVDDLVNGESMLP